MLVSKECEWCGEVFKSQHKNGKRFCSIPCRAANQRSGLASGTLGALSELVVCADLLKRGFDVYRSVSPHVPCDLLVVKDGITWRVEVKTRGKGKNFSATYHLKEALKHNKFQVLALVDGQEILYLLENGDHFNFQEGR